MTELVLPDFNNLPEMTKDDVRQLIGQVEKACLEFGEQIDIPIENYFSDKVYAREMKMPAGALVVGKIHKKTNLSILSEGEVSVLSTDGVMRIKAPHTFVASPGVKRVIFAHSDCTWTVVHGTEETDLEKIEDEFIAKDYKELKSEEDLCLGSWSASQPQVLLQEK